MGCSVGGECGKCTVKHVCGAWRVSHTGEEIGATSSALPKKHWPMIVGGGSWEVGALGHGEGGESTEWGEALVEASSTG